MRNREVILSYIEGVKVDINELKRKRNDLSLQIIHEETKLIDYVKEYMNLFNLETKIVNTENNPDRAYVIVGINLIKTFNVNSKIFHVVSIEDFLDPGCKDLKPIKILNEDEMLKYKIYEGEK